MWSSRVVMCFAVSSDCSVHANGKSSVYQAMPPERTGSSISRFAFDVDTRCVSELADVTGSVDM